MFRESYQIGCPFLARREKHRAFAFIQLSAYESHLDATRNPGVGPVIGGILVMPVADVSQRHLQPVGHGEDCFGVLLG
jgi:hypothetical protein